MKIMNNIIVEDDNISFEDEVVSIQINTHTLNMYIIGNVTLNELKCNPNLKKLNITIEENSCLNYNRFSDLELNNLEINVNIKNNGRFYGAWAFISKDKHNIKINTSMNGNNIQNILDVHILSQLQGDCFIKVNADVSKDTIDSVMKENIRVLNTNDNQIEVCPSMLVSSNEVQADHFNTISGINEEELFYLESKGLSKEKSEKLIEKGFIHSIFTNDFINLLK